MRICDVCGEIASEKIAFQVSREEIDLCTEHAEKVKEIVRKSENSGTPETSRRVKKGKA